MRAPLARPLAFVAILLSSSTAAFAFPSGFIGNRGQVDDQVLYYALGSRGAVFLTRSAIVFDLKEAPPLPAGHDPFPDPLSDRSEEDRPSPGPGCAVYFRFEGASSSPAVEASGMPATEYNYFIGKDPSTWRAEVPAYEEIVYRGLWPGVDLVLHEEGGRLIYEVKVAPHSDPSAVRFTYEGAAAVGMDDDGSTLIETSAGALRHVPAVPGVRPGHVEPASTETASFSAGAAGKESDDPSALLWSTFLGGSDYDEAFALVLDFSGNPVLAGYSNSVDFPATPGAYDVSHNGLSDVFVAAISGTGSSLLWGTFLGGSDHDLAYALAVDSTGDLLLTGRTYSSDFPATPGAYDTSENGSNDAFVVKLSGTGSALLWGTFLGGNSLDDGYAIAVDRAGNPVLTGRAYSSGFPTTPGAYDPSHNGSNEAFVAKLSSTGSALLWSTFLGGSGGEDGLALVVDPSGDPVLAGYSSSTDFPTTPGAYDTTPNGSNDLFAAKLSGTGSTLVWSTLLGGSADDDGLALALDPSGNPVLAGYSSSTDFPTTPGAFDTTQNGSYDVVVAMLSGTGSALLWSTFLGGNSIDQGRALALDPSGGLVLAGYSSSSDFPATPWGYDSSPNGSRDAVAVKLSGTGSICLWSTFLGGGSDDRGFALALAPSGDLVLAGRTSSSDFPATPGAFDTSYGGSGFSDGFVARLSITDPMDVADGRPGEGEAFLIGEPNPVRGAVRLRYQLGREAPVSLRVYDIAGRAVVGREMGLQSAGPYDIEWDGRDAGGRPLAPGVYFARLRAGEHTVTKKMVLLP